MIDIFPATITNLVPSHFYRTLRPANEVESLHGNYWWMKVRSLKKQMPRGWGSETQSLVLNELIRVKFPKFRYLFIVEI